jgi:butyrate kinase
MIEPIHDVHEKKRVLDHLKDKIVELERFRRVMVDREMRMKELREEIKELKGEK